MRVPAPLKGGNEMTAICRANSKKGDVEKKQKGGREGKAL